MASRAAHAATTPARRESEREFQAAVIELARHAGWLCYHDADSRRSAPGFPDLTLVYPQAHDGRYDGRVIFAELKTARGRVRREQRTWLWALGTCPGVEVALWRPGDFPQIVSALVHGERLPSLGL